MLNTLYIEIESAQETKHNQVICGDAIFSCKIPNEQRIVSVLSDGLGSGVKANVLASMTSRMAAKFIAGNMEILRSSEIIMEALPICQVRKISYATFTIIDCTAGGNTRVFEMDNPPMLFIRDGKSIPLPFEELSSPKWEKRKIRVYEFETKPEDRIIVFSDGISQAGLGNRAYPLGWRNEGCEKFVLNIINNDKNISARSLARMIIDEAKTKEIGEVAGDDMSCTVVYFRKPRKLLLLSGPPFDENKDSEIAETFNNYEGKKAICGGTSANIIERELELKSRIDTSTIDKEIPAASIMERVDLVTEGILTLTKVAQILEDEIWPKKKNAAVKLADLLLDSDIIEFMVGTRINNAHQDPNLPVDLEIRRNIIKRINKVLTEKYLKETTIKFI
ncbi:MAG: SpoIIE family protein phosphatase [Alphaproteobacteria bacterium]